MADTKDELKHVNASGQFVEADALDVAFQVNMGEEGALNFVDGLKKKSALSPTPSSNAEALEPDEAETKVITTASLSTKPGKQK